ncbi:hypothetical protein [Pseudacidovorax sp. RU35E]|jgi:hypothetical protein|nr:hypothetical protein [Pseudacidovorax sp. RU35E]SIR50403.1 hypothetical protein SAMN05880557_11271 [Pseudacidovorax sp. RU35E]
MGLPTGEGYYKYPDPVFRRPDFPAVPDMARVDEIVARIQTD